MGTKPPALASMPALKATLWWALEAFYELSAGREYGMGGAQQIRVSEILAYCQLVGIDDHEQQAQLMKYVQHMDPVFLEHIHNLVKKETSS